jgi:hypothetical protein
MPQAAESRRLTQAIAWRAAAIRPFAIAALANVAYGMLRQARGLRSPKLAKVCLCFVAFTTTWCGVLLLLHGRRLFHPASLPEVPPVTSDPLRAVCVATFEDRHAMAQMLTTHLLLRVQAAHRRSQLRGVENTEETPRARFQPER